VRAPVSRDRQSELLGPRPLPRTREFLSSDEQAMGFLRHCRAARLGVAVLSGARIGEVVQTELVQI
jgi:hypothetical protein